MSVNARAAPHGIMNDGKRASSEGGLTLEKLDVWVVWVVQAE